MTIILEDPIPLPGKWAIMEGVTWEEYERLRAETDAAGSHVRITYDNGRMLLMSPLPIHERIKKFTGGLIELTVVEFDIPCARLGSTTWKRKDLRKGLEADECYYIQHEADVRGKDRLDLKRDPPPDLAVEVDITHHPLDRMSIYSRLGVREIWHHDGSRIGFFKRRADNTYRSIKKSEALPMLAPSIINRYLDMLPTTDETTIMRAFRDWLRTLPEAKQSLSPA